VRFYERGSRETPNSQTSTSQPILCIKSPATREERRVAAADAATLPPAVIEVVAETVLVEAVLELMALTWLLLIMTTTRTRPRRKALRRAIF